jgi:hypothetical protein
MRASGCSSFSIAISIEGMPIAVSRTGLSGKGQGLPVTSIQFDVGCMVLYDLRSRGKR